MADCLILKNGGGVYGSDDCTAEAADVLETDTAIVKGSNDAPVKGTMPEKGAWTGSVAMNSQVSIPEGHHDGNGYVSGPVITDQGAVDVTLDVNGSYTIPKGYHNGSGKVHQSVTVKNNQVYNTSTKDQSVAAGTYVNGLTVKGVTTENISAANIKNGVTVKVGDANSAGRIKNITGSCIGERTSINANAYYGSGDESNSFTMPRAGVIVYGGFGHYPQDSGTGVCEVQINGVVITDMGFPNSGGFYERPSTVNKVRAVNAGDVITVRAYVSARYSSAQVSCVCIY